MPAEKKKDPWKTGYASDDSSSGGEDEQGPSGYRRAALNADRRLAADLDFANRYETVKFTPTPFNLAQINAAFSAQRSDPPSSTAPQASQDRAPPSSSTAVQHFTQSDNSAWKVVDGKVGAISSSSEPRRQLGRSIPIANPDPGGRNDARRLEQQKVEEKRDQARQKQSDKAKKRDWTKYSGWTERDQPVPITKVRRSLTDVADEQEAAAARAKKRGGGAKKATQVIDEDGEAQAPSGKAPKKAPAKKAKAASKPKATKGKRKQKDEEKITFGRIPAGAGPSDNFPIVQALDKQRDLPTKPRAKKKPTAARSKLNFKSALSDTDSDGRVDLDQLFEGIARDTHQHLEEDGRKDHPAECAATALLETEQIAERAASIERSAHSDHRSPKPVNIPAQTMANSSLHETAAADNVYDPNNEIDSDIGCFDSDEEAANKADEEQGDVAAEVREQNKHLAELRASLMRDNAALARKRSKEGMDRPHSPVNDESARSYAGKALRKGDLRRAPHPQGEHEHQLGRAYSLEVEPPTGDSPLAHDDRALHDCYDHERFSDAGYGGSSRLAHEGRIAGPGEHGKILMTPYGSDNFVPPSTTTRVSLPHASKYFVAPSSSSQLPYSSPLERHVREMRQDSKIATPAPHRLPTYGLENVSHLETMAHDADAPYRTSDDLYPRPFESGRIPQDNGTGHIQHLEDMAESFGVYNHHRQPPVPSRDHYPYDSPTSHPHQPVPGRPRSPSAPDDRPQPSTTDRLNSYIYTPAMGKRAPSPASSPVLKVKPIKRTRAERVPLNGGADSRRRNTDTWSTLEPLNKKKRTSPDIIQTPGFRLPSNYFALSHSLQPGLNNGKSGSSSASARAGWFKPSDPGAATKTGSIKDNYSTVTSRGVQPGRQKEQDSKTRPTFVTRARREERPADDQDRFHNQLRAAVGIQGQTRVALRDLQGSRQGVGLHANEEAEGDWRDAWKNGGRGVRGTTHNAKAPSVLQNRFNYAGPKQNRAAPVAEGRAFEF